MKRLQVLNENLAAWILLPTRAMVAQAACAAVEALEPRVLLSAAYSVSLIGTPQSSPAPAAVNRMGEVAGSYVGGDGSERAFSYLNGAFKDLGTPAGTSAAVAAINDSGQIAGDLESVATGKYEGFVYSGGRLITFSVPGSNYVSVVAINAAGQVIGNDLDSAGNFHGFLYSDGNVTDLGTLGGPDTRVAAMNDAGTVVGYSEINQVEPDSTNYIRHAFIYSHGTMTDLGTLGGLTSVATAINNQGTVIGAADVASGPRHAFQTANGKMRDLDAGVGGAALAINTAGEIAGDLYDASGAEHLFICSNSNVKDLGTFGLASVSINDAGDVLGTSFGSTVWVYRNETVSDLSTLIDPQALGGGTLLQGTAALGNGGQIVAQISTGQGLLLTPANSGSISGNVFDDTSADGIQNYGESGLPGVTVYQDVTGKGQFVSSDPSTTTDSTGQYTFSGLAPGPYTIRIVPPSTDWKQFPQSVTLASGQSLTNVSFATFPLYRFAVADLGTLGGASSSASGINDAGEVVGQADTSNGTRHAFLFNPSNQKMTDLGAFGGPDSSAAAINQLGQVVGTADTTQLDENGDRITLAFLYSDGKLIDLGTLFGQSSFATGINDHGQIIGYTLQPNPDDPYVPTNDVAFVYQNGQMTAIEPPASEPFEDSIALSIDDSGRVDGYFYDPPFKGENGSYQEFNEVNGVITLIGDTTTGSYLEAISAASNTTLGSMIVSSGADHAFLYSNSQAVDLNDTLPPNAGWVLTNATAINRSNQIVGQGLNPEGQTHAFVLTPVLASISGTFFYDGNHNGIWDPGEAPSPSWGVYIDANNDGKYDSGDTEIIANAHGQYTFGNLAPGSYVVRGTTASGWTQTSPPNGGAQIVTVSAGQAVTGVNFGEFHGTIPTAKGFISGTFFYDGNSNGVWDAGEAPSPSWGVYIDANDDGVYDAGDTELIANAHGQYTFSNLAAGTYVIRATTASGWKQTDPANGGAQVIHLAAGQNATGVNFGEFHG